MADPVARHHRRWSTPALLLLPSAALMIYALVLPLLTFLRYSFYRNKSGRLQEAFVFDAYREFITDPYYHAVVSDTLWMALMVTVLAVAISYPLAYVLWRINRPGLQRWLGLIIFSPILISVVVRSYGWTVLLADQGPVNVLAQAIGLTHDPVRLVYNLPGVVIALTHVFLPFVVFPIFGALVRLDPALAEAATDLGASWWTVFRRITFPLSLPGLIAGTQICFTLALGAFVTPALLGGGHVLVLPLEIYQATSNIDWPLASVGNLALLVMAFVVVSAFNRLIKLAET